MSERVYSCITCTGTITTADDLITVNVNGRSRPAHRECPTDGQGGWWCCVGCGSLAELTFQQGFCTRCGSVDEDFYRDGEYK